MKKIKGEFFTEREAILTIDKIKPYCGNIKIIYGGNVNPNYIPDEYDFDFPRMNSVNPLNFGGFGVISNWNYNSYGYENKYNYNFYQFYQSERTALEIEVADDNYEYVKEKLYSNGAMFVS